MARAHAYACYLLILLPALACCLLCSVVAQSQPTGEGKLLLQIKREWGDPPALAAWNWSAATSSTLAHCIWPYVVCDSVGRISGLTLDNLNLVGTFPTVLQRCGSLRYLNLSWNRLTGSLPDTISSNLTWLDIRNNQFAGRIPSVAIGLEYFIADNNQFSGHIPANLGYGMPVLKRLYLRNNKLSGRIS